MSENKNAKTPADGPEYERGFVEGMQRQMQLHVNRVIREEPTAWLKTWSDGSLSVLKTKSHAFADHELEPLYAAPPKREWVGLTDEQVEDEWERITGHGIFGGDRSEGRAMYISPDEVIEFSRAIEAKLKEKNRG